MLFLKLFISSYSQDKSLEARFIQLITHFSLVTQPLAFICLLKGSYSHMHSKHILIDPLGMLNLLSFVVVSLSL